MAHHNSYYMSLEKEAQPKHLIIATKSSGCVTNFGNFTQIRSCFVIFEWYYFKCLDAFSPSNQPWKCFYIHICGFIKPNRFDKFDLIECYITLSFIDYNKILQEKSVQNRSTQRGDICTVHVQFCL